MEAIGNELTTSRYLLRSVARLLEWRRQHRDHSGRRLRSAPAKPRPRKMPRLPRPRLPRRRSATTTNVALRRRRLNARPRRPRQPARPRKPSKRAQQAERERAAAEAAAQAAADKQAKEAEAARQRAAASAAAAKEASCKDEQNKLETILARDREGSGVDDLKNFSRAVTCDHLGPVVAAAIDRLNAEVAERAANQPNSPELI